MKRILTIILVLHATLMLAACGSSSGSSGDGDATESSTIDTSPYEVSVASTAATYDATDLVANTTFDYAVTIDFTANTVQVSGGTAQNITSSGVTPVTGITVATTTGGVTITSTLSSAVRYNLTGTLSGTLTVSSSAACQLYLNGVTISGSSGPALTLSQAQKAFIVLAGGTTNTLTDSSSRTSGKKAAFYSEGPAIISGTGTLNVTGNYKHGIFSNDYIRVCGGTINVTVTARDAIRSVNGFIFDDGNLTITATGTTTDDESKGIKVEGSETTGTGKGYIVINGGYITITSVSKGITASWDVDEDASTTQTSDDPDPYVVINNGIITVTTTGTPYEYTSGSTTVSCSPEGIEGKSYLTINSGYIIINTSDDCLNAGEAIAINGGYLYCRSSSNDAIDSNGTMTITGGVIVAIGSDKPEEAFDCDNNTFTITGGTFVGIAGSTSTPTAGTCTQNAVILGSGTSGNTMALVSSAGTVALSYAIPQSYSTMLLSSPAVASGSQYTVKTGGSASADNLFYGLYLGNIAYSGGTAGTSFSVSSSVTNAGGTTGAH